MAHRREDVGLLELFQQHEARLRRLEGPDKGVRRNDIRIGDQLIQEGTDDNTLTVTDLRDGSQFTLPQDLSQVGEEEVFWPFELRFSTLGTGANGMVGGPWIAPFDVEITKVIFTFDAQNSSLWAPTTVNYQARSGPDPLAYSTNYIEIASPLMTDTAVSPEQWWAAEASATAAAGWGYDPDRSPRYMNEGDALSWIWAISNPSLTSNNVLIGSVSMYYVPR